MKTPRTKTVLLAGLSLAVERPRSFPKGCFALIHRDEAMRIRIIRPDPETGAWRIDRWQAFGLFEAESGLGGIFAGPEAAAVALSDFLARGCRAQTPDEGVGLLFREISSVAAG